MAVYTASGAVVSIGGTTRMANLAAYEAETWQEISDVNEIGSFGSSANIVAYQVLGDGFVQKSKGTRDNGDLALKLGYNGLDQGQIDIAAAEATNSLYNFKVELPDAADGDDTPTFLYFAAIVASKAFEGMSNESIIERVYALGISGTIIEDAPAVV